MRKVLGICSCLILRETECSQNTVPGEGHPVPESDELKEVSTKGAEANVLANRATIRHNGCTLQLFLDYTAFGPSTHQIPADFNPCIERGELETVSIDELGHIRGVKEAAKRLSPQQIKCSQEIGDGKYWEYAKYGGSILTGIESEREEAKKLCAIIMKKFEVVKKIVVEERKETFQKDVASCGGNIDVSSLDLMESDEWVRALVAQAKVISSKTPGKYANCIQTAVGKLPKIGRRDDPKVVAQPSNKFRGISVKLLDEGGLVFENEQEKCYLEIVIPDIVSIDPFQHVDPCVDLSQKLKKSELPIGWSIESGYVTGGSRSEFDPPRDEEPLYCRRGGVVFARYIGPDTWSTRNNRICRAIAHKFAEVEQIKNSARKAEGGRVLDCLKLGRKSFVNCVLASPVAIKGIPKYSDPTLASLVQCFSNPVLEPLETQQAKYAACVGSLTKAGSLVDENVPEVKAVICVGNKFLESKIDLGTHDDTKPVTRRVAITACTRKRALP